MSSKIIEIPEEIPKGQIKLDLIFFNISRPAPSPLIISDSTTVSGLYKILEKYVGGREVLICKQPSGLLLDPEEGARILGELCNNGDSLLVMPKATTLG